MMLSETAALLVAGFLGVTTLLAVTMLVRAKTCNRTLQVAAYDEHPDACDEADYCPRCEIEGVS